MSQHDFDIANQTNPSLRSDLNNALQAIASKSSGAGTPSTTYPYQEFIDTTDDVVLRRNAANSANIILRSAEDDIAVTKTGAYTVLKKDMGRTILCDASSSAFTVTLIDATSVDAGFELRIIKTDSSSNAVTVDGHSSQTVSGDATKDLVGQYGVIHLISDGSNFHAINYDSGWGSWAPTLTPAGSMTYTSTSITFAKYRINNGYFKSVVRFTGTIGGTLNKTMNYSLPSGITPVDSHLFVYGNINDPEPVENSSGVQLVGFYDSGVVGVRKYNGGLFGAGSSKHFLVSCEFLV